jgi:hypothetical protein
VSDDELEQQTSTRREGNDVHDTRDGLVIYASGDDVVHQLNPMSTLIYELSDGRSLGSIAQSVAAVFDLTEPEARELTSRGVDELRSAGLVT